MKDNINQKKTKTKTQRDRDRRRRRARISKMEDGLFKNTEIPLLETAGTASTLETLGNIIVSIVGTGILGLPFALRIAGWFGGSLAIIIAGISTCYCMHLLVQCKEKLASEELTQETITYGDLGYKCMGQTGQYLTEFLIFMSQCGGSVAYLVFIGQNLSSSFKSQGLNISSFLLVLVPIEIGLSWVGSLSALAPFSIFADVCNVLAMAVVVKEDVQKMLTGEFRFSDRYAVASNIGGLPFALGMAVFCFEGFAMTLPLEASMRERSRFLSLLAKTFTGITLVYVLFGFSGYMAYGDQTNDIITLNLPHNWSTIAIKIGLCLGLVFTFPIAVHPMHEIMEGKLKKSEWFQKIYYNTGADETSTRVGRFGIYVTRAILIICLAVLALFVPGFGFFASLVGSTVCGLIAFVLPSIYHLQLLGPSLHLWQRALDYFLLIAGLVFAAYGTYNSVVGV